MKFSNDQPIYTQIVDHMKYKIIRNELKPGEQVPSVRQVATDLKVNPNTVQRAFGILRDEEIFYAKRGLGSFVTDDTSILENIKKDMAVDIFKSFITEIDNLGLSKDRTLELLKEFWEEYYDQDK